tara:strand:- start:4048 stop:4743 length:696 start_codon:yes stop_codon:yes gene_type:complete
MYCIPNFFKYIYFPFNLINIKKDLIYNDTDQNVNIIMNSYLNICNTDLNNEFIKINDKKILIISNSNNLYNELNKIYKKQIIQTDSKYDIEHKDIDIVIIDIDYEKNIELINVLLNNLLCQKKGSSMIFKMRLHDIILDDFCFFLSGVYNKLSIGKLDCNNYLIIRCEDMSGYFFENILYFNKILSNVKVLNSLNINIISIIDNNYIPQIYKNRYNEILRYIKINKTLIRI